MRLYDKFKEIWKYIVSLTNSLVSLTLNLYFLIGSSLLLWKACVNKTNTRSNKKIKDVLGFALFFSYFFYVSYVSSLLKQFWYEPWWTWKSLWDERSWNSKTYGSSHYCKYQSFFLVFLQSRLYHQLSRVSNLWRVMMNCSRSKPLLEA